MTEKTVTRTIRLNREVAERYENISLRSVIESVYEQDGTSLSVSNEGITVYTPSQGINNKELESMANFWGTTAQDLVNQFVDLLTEGTIQMRDGILWVDECPFRYEDFVDRCREVKIDPQKTIDRFTRMIG